MPNWMVLVAGYLLTGICVTGFTLRRFRRRSDQPLPPGQLGIVLVALVSLWPLLLAMGGVYVLGLRRWHAQRRALGLPPVTWELEPPVRPHA